MCEGCAKRDGALTEGSQRDRQTAEVMAKIMKDMDKAIQLTDWLIAKGRGCRGFAELVDELGGLFKDSDLHPMRINIVLGALHPEVAIQLLVWRSSAGFTETAKSAQVFELSESQMNHGIVKEISLGNASIDNPVFLASPVYKIIHREQDFIHEPLPQERKEFNYSILEDFKESGATDYVALPITFSNKSRGCLSCVTNKSGGYTETDLKFFEKMAPIISPLLEVHASHQVAKTLLNTYLGVEPGLRVLSGEIKRGDVHTLKSALWFSDLRDFTEISGRLESKALIGLLNQYFEIVGDAIKTHGGEILKFMGDAVLAVFPVNEDQSENAACDNAYKAATEASKNLDQAKIDYGIALHFGEAQYGNIGATDRLDFTVIGNAVNMAARIEELCPELKCKMLASKEFVEKLKEKYTFQSTGEHQLRGISEKQELFKGPI